ncbi:dienelactone hydrolase family protein [Undibacterium flavidum]|uniref:Hydrolase n=1 Tax=Undibacterium flavidum TaxID=2762297 RepID=A0ABR6YH32_9BURK|nr:hydrolase [Undibacterium flavidum]MBC3875900.1 hydrolase [Undibacterium flavidum]
MQTLVATDIHGINNDLKALFQDNDGEIRFLSPWNLDGCPFETEQEAVAAFHAKNGLTTYQQKIAEAAGSTPCLLIGFSVGATSMWLHTASENCHPDSYAQLIYGSRIRDYLSLVPRCPTSLIFAEHESSFRPETVAAKMIHTQVECTIIKDTHHGFMNPHSPHFNEAHTRGQLTQIKSFLTRYNKRD